MTVNKIYNIGDAVWIHGVGSSKVLTRGTVVATVDLSHMGYDRDQNHYVISIPTHIEPLLEIRTWESISQDEHGPIGLFRMITEDLTETNKKMSQFGYYTDDSSDDPTDDEIVAALARTNADLQHRPLDLKNPKPKKRYYNRKKRL